MPSRHQIVELFAGIAGVSTGFWESGFFTPALLLDIDPSAKGAFVFNHPRLGERFVCEDLSSLTAKEIVQNAGATPRGIVGCPPCQGLSEVGPRRHVDKRNHLVDHYFRLVRSVGPEFFVMENVPRVLSYARFLKQLRRTAARYKIWAGVLNAAQYGVPQTRRRAIVVGYRKDLDVQPTPPPITHCGAHRVFAYDRQKLISPANRANWKSILGTYAESEKCGDSTQPAVGTRLLPLVTCSDALSDLPKASARQLQLPYKAPAKTAYQALMRKRAHFVTNHRPWNHDAELISRMRKLRAGESPLSRLGRMKHPYYSQAYARLHPKGLGRTVTTNFHNAGAGRFWHYRAERTLTIREAARLQSFPDRFIFPDNLPRTVQERLLGNAFPPLLARKIAQHIFKEIGHLLERSEDRRRP
jgi:DNA (cytosine-5)-methyltransferase 1